MTTRTRGARAPLASVGLHLTLLGASVIAVFPVLWILLTSLKPAEHAVTTDFIKEPSLGNYTYLLESSHFLSWFGNSVLVVEASPPSSVCSSPPPPDTRSAASSSPA